MNMMKKQYSIAIDGPSGSGKSTLSKAIANELGILYVDTGAIYRTIGYYLFCHKLDPKKEAEVMSVLPQLCIEMKYESDGLQHMYLDGKDVTKEIRLPEVSMYASDCSAHAKVRAFLLEMQQRLAREQSVIMDGRDIGTIVLPDAEVKVFLTASPEIRAQRRYKELMERGTEKAYAEVLAELIERDYNDTHREVAPLRPAEDSVSVDTSALDFEQSKQTVLSVIREKVGL